MDVRKRSEKAVQEACEVLSATLDEAQAKEVSDVIERAMIDVMREAAKQHSYAVEACCPADRDLAHKISEEIRRKNVGLIANLTGLRS